MSGGQVEQKSATWLRMQKILNEVQGEMIYKRKGGRTNQ